MTLYAALHSSNRLASPADLANDQPTRIRIDHRAGDVGSAHAPYRAWSNFEFRDNRGRWHEVDLLVLAKDQLHLIELKHYRGILRGDAHRWLWPGKRAEDPVTGSNG